MSSKTPQMNQLNKLQQQIHKGTGMGVLDDIERVPNSNLMVENTILTLRNISNNFNMHEELLQNGFLEVIKKFLDVFFYAIKSSKEHDVEGEILEIDLESMPLGCVNLMKALMVTILNFSMN